MLPLIPEETSNSDAELQRVWLVRSHVKTMKKVRMRKVVLLFLLAAFAIVVLYPLETTVVPEWRVRIVDEAGAPLRNTGIREVWEHYSIESESHQQDLLTDSDGYVTFPKRTIRAGLAVRTVKSVINALNPHGSSGPGAYLITLAPGYDTWRDDFYIPGQPLPSQMVVRKANQ